MFIDLAGTRPYFNRLIKFFIVLGVLFLLLAAYFWAIADFSPFIREASLAIASAIVGSMLYDMFKETYNIYK